MINIDVKFYFEFYEKILCVKNSNKLYNKMLKNINLSENSYINIGM